jgi:hypothetical protein
MIGNDPREDASHLSGGDKFIVQWAEANGYEYAMLAESDLQAAPSVLNAYDTLIINVHSEYWTTQMYDGLDQFLAQGGNLLYLGGNAIHWKVTFEGREMEVRKDRGRHDHSGERGGLWRELQRNSVGTLGLEFDIAAVSAGTNAPFEVVEASHWVFEGANVAPGDRFGGQGANHRDDQEPGASGWELDVFNDQSPPGAVHLARGTNPVRPEFVDRYDEGVPGDIIYWDHPGGGGAFAAGSITFTGSLMVDDTMSTMLNNVLERFGH